MLEIPYNQVITYASNHFWLQRRTRAKKTAFQSIKNDLAKRIENHRISHQHFVLDQLTETQEYIETMVTGKDKESGQVHPMEKLTVLDKHDTIARRTLKLDDEKKPDPIQNGFAFVVAVQTQHRTERTLVNDNATGDTTGEGDNASESEIIELEETPIEPQNTTQNATPEGGNTDNEKAPENTPIPPSAPYPLLSNKNPNTGILSAANDPLESSQTANRASKRQEIRELPKVIEFQPPKRLVNENEQEEPPQRKE